MESAHDQQRAEKEQQDRTLDLDAILHQANKGEQTDPAIVCLLCEALMGVSDYLRDIEDVVGTLMARHDLTDRDPDATPVQRYNHAQRVYANTRTRRTQTQRP